MIIKIADEDHPVSFDMEKWKGQGPYLGVIAKGTPRQRRHVLEHANKHLLHCLCECALNIIEGRVELNAAEKRALARHWRKLAILAYPDIPLKYKRKVLRQRGAGKFFQNIILPALRSIPTFLTSLIPKLS